jgi:hypothetical protein
MSFEYGCITKALFLLRRFVALTTHLNFENHVLAPFTCRGTCDGLVKGKGSKTGTSNVQIALRATPNTKSSKINAIKTERQA